MSTLTAIHVARTGHLLAALTRLVPPPADEPVAALVGIGLPVRLLSPAPDPSSVTVPAEMLAAVTIEGATAVPDDPRVSRVVEVERNGEVIHQLDANLIPSATVTLTETAVTAATPGAAVVEQPVVIVMEQPGTRLVREGVIPVGGTSVAMSVSPSPGQWQVVAFIAGHELALRVQPL